MRGSGSRSGASTHEGSGSAKFRVGIDHHSAPFSQRPPLRVVGQSSLIAIGRHVSHRGKDLGAGVALALAEVAAGAEGRLDRQDSTATRTSLLFTVVGCCSRKQLGGLALMGADLSWHVVHVLDRGAFGWRADLPGSAPPALHTGTVHPLVRRARSLASRNPKENTLVRLQRHALSIWHGASWCLMERLRLQRGSRCRVYFHRRLLRFVLNWVRSLLNHDETQKEIVEDETLLEAARQRRCSPMRTLYRLGQIVCVRTIVSLWDAVARRVVAVRYCSACLAHVLGVVV